MSGEKKYCGLYSSSAEVRCFYKKSIVMDHGARPIEEAFPQLLI